MSQWKNIGSVIASIIATTLLGTSCLARGADRESQGSAEAVTYLSAIHTDATQATSSTPATTSGTTETAGMGAWADMDPPEMAGMTAAHNAVRASVNPPANPAIPPLAWSASVAAVAQAYAQSCVFAHSGGSYGENIYATTGSATPLDVVTSWASESADYTYATNSCSGVCGHYTQVVWRNSTNLGCGVADCSANSPFGDGSWQFWVCNYDPPGNYSDESPY